MAATTGAINNKPPVLEIVSLRPTTPLGCRGGDKLRVLLLGIPVAFDLLHIRGDKDDDELDADADTNADGDGDIDVRGDDADVRADLPQTGDLILLLLLLLGLLLLLALLSLLLFLLCVLRAIFDIERIIIIIIIMTPASLTSPKQPRSRYCTGRCANTVQ